MQRSKKRKLRRLQQSTMLRRGLPMASTLIVAMSGVNAQETGGAGIGEIIVTATKREERLQDVPLAIQAFSNEDLQELRISDFDDYVKFLPNVSYQELGPGFARVFMRGVSSGDNGNHSGPLPTVGMYLDEQPITTIQGPLDIHIYDIARVETLAGPQGTLYGASSEAGTIRIITNKPEVGKSSSAYNLEINSVANGDPGGIAEGYVNIPISDNMAIRLVGWYQHDAGYIDNVFGTRTYPTLQAETGNGTFDNASQAKDNYNTADTYGGRAALRIELNDRWTITPTIMAQSQNTKGSFAYDLATGDDFAVTHYYPESSNDNWYQAALTVEGKLSDWTLTYAGAWLDRDDNTLLDYTDYALAYDNYYFGSATSYGDYFFNDNGDTISPAERINGVDGYTKFSQELRIASPADRRLRFVGGLFYQDQKHNIEQRYIIDDLATSLEVTGWPDTWWLTEQTREDEDKAAFGEVTFDITEKLSVTGGLRVFKSDNSLKGFLGFGYTNDWPSFHYDPANPTVPIATGEKSCFGFEYSDPDGPNPPDPAPPNNPPVPHDPPPSPKGGLHGSPCYNLDKSVSDNDETHKLNLTYRFDPDHMIYATYSTGYRPGGVNRRNEPGFGPYKPDFLDSYEIGWKTTWAGGALRWNGAVFYQNWDNFQFGFLGANGLTNVKNAPGGAEIPGVETEVEWAATDNLTLSTALMYVKPELNGDFCEDSLVAVADCDPAQFAADGTTLPVTPKFKGNLLARYAYAFGEYSGHFQGSLVYQGEARSALLPADEQLLGGKQDAYSIVNLSANVEKNATSVELFVDNVFDERADLYRFAECDEFYCGGSAGLGGTTYSVANQPRTVGVRFGQKFGK